MLITHGHSDHYMGLAPVLERFSQARVLAREAVREEIALEFSAKRLRSGGRLTGPGRRGRLVACVDKGSRARCLQ